MTFEIPEVWDTCIASGRQIIMWKSTSSSFFVKEIWYKLAGGSLPAEKSQMQYPIDYSPANGVDPTVRFVMSYNKLDSSGSRCAIGRGAGLAGDSPSGGAVSFVTTAEEASL